MTALEPPFRNKNPEEKTSKMRRVADVHEACSRCYKQANNHIKKSRASKYRGWRQAAELIRRRYQSLRGGPFHMPQR